MSILEQTVKSIVLTKLIVLKNIDKLNKEDTIKFGIKEVEKLFKTVFSQDELLDLKKELEELLNREG